MLETSRKAFWETTCAQQSNVTGKHRRVKENDIKNRFKSIRFNGIYQMFDHRPIYCHTVLNSSHKCAPIQQWCLQRCGGQWSLTVVMCPFHSTPHYHTNGNMSLTIFHWHWEITSEAVNTTAGLNSPLVLHYARWHGVSVLCWALGLVYGHSRLSQEFSKIQERSQDADFSSGESPVM